MPGFFLTWNERFIYAKDGVAMIVKCIMNKTRGTVGQQSKCRLNLLTIIYLADRRGVPKVSQAGTVVMERNIRLSGCNCNNVGAIAGRSQTNGDQVAVLIRKTGGFIGFGLLAEHRRGLFHG